jgi:hypothetical protein
MPCPDIIRYNITEHAQWEMQRRGLSEAEVQVVLHSAEQRAEVRSGRCIYQSRVVWGEPVKVYLLRVVVDVDRNPPEVVTAYRTSKIDKYWG